MSLPRRNASRVPPSGSGTRRRRRASGAPRRSASRRQRRRRAHQRADAVAARATAPRSGARGFDALHRRLLAHRHGSRRFWTAPLSPLATGSLESTPSPPRGTSPRERPSAPRLAPTSSSGSRTASTSSTPAFTGRCFDAAYLIVERGRAAFVDTGTNHSVPRLLAALAAAGLDADAVDYVIPTHVHLDHAGGVGLLMQQLPRGAPRRPSARRAPPARPGAPDRERDRGLRRRGDRALVRHAGRRSPPSACSTTRDGMTHRARRPAAALPRHARPRDAPPLHLGRARAAASSPATPSASRTATSTPRAGAWIMPTTTPVQFQPEALRRSIERMLAFEPERDLRHPLRPRSATCRASPRCCSAQLDEMVALARAASRRRRIAMPR